ncbi:hypothetical protein PLICRDRAFT_632191 [Plicaturopsis crispa FD-325 SS-3]|nr:hypothetical protein PLICRDRAFT_632191 [Plicaturopsis crispa FD-325 SS-3]
MSTGKSYIVVIWARHPLGAIQLLPWESNYCRQFGGSSGRAIDCHRALRLIPSQTFPSPNRKSRCTESFCKSYSIYGVSVDVRNPLQRVFMHAHASRASSSDTESVEGWGIGHSLRITSGFVFSRGLSRSGGPCFPWRRMHVGHVLMWVVPNDVGARMWVVLRSRRQIFHRFHCSHRVMSAQTYAYMRRLRICRQIAAFVDSTFFPLTRSATALPPIKPDKSVGYRNASPRYSKNILQSLL